MVTLILLLSHSSPISRRATRNSFLYFENTGKEFKTIYNIRLHNSGRWLVMDANDIDQDGDKDLF
jgi:hypothetical protein